MIWIALIFVACISAALIGLFSGGKIAPMPKEPKRPEERWKVKEDEMVGKPVNDFIKAWRDNPRRFRMRWVAIPIGVQREGMKQGKNMKYLRIVDKQENIRFDVLVYDGRFYSASENGEELSWINHWEGRYLANAVQEIVEEKLHRRNRLRNLAANRAREAAKQVELERRKKFIDIYSKGENE